MCFLIVKTSGFCDKRRTYTGSVFSELVAMEEFAFGDCCYCLLASSISLFPNLLRRS